MFNNAWLAFKLLFSTALAAVPVALLAVAPRTFTDPAFIGIAALLLFFAALPWVNFTRPNRAFALAGIVFSLVIALLAARTAFGFVELPRQCTGRRVAFCEFENFLFSLGGEYLAAAPFCILAVFLFTGSVRMLRRSWPTQQPFEVPK